MNWQRLWQTLSLWGRRPYRRKVLFNPAQQDRLQPHIVTIASKVNLELRKLDRNLYAYPEVQSIIVGAVGDDMLLTFNLYMPREEDMTFYVQFKDSTSYAYGVFGCADKIMQLYRKSL